MNASRTVTGTALLVLAGCIPAWVNPAREDAAKLALVPETRSHVHVSGFADGKECRNQLNLAGRGSLRHRTEILIPPGEEFTILAFLTDPSWNCSIAASFLPEARESYMALFDGSPTACKMRILRSNGAPEPSVRQRFPKQSIWSSDSRCK